MNGRTGRRFVMRAGVGKEHSGATGMDVVIAEDPALALIGRATSHALAPSTSAFGQFTPRAFLELRERARAGAILRAGPSLILESVSNRPIDPDRFTVQGTPISREELQGIMQRAFARAKQQLAEPPPAAIR